MRKNITGLISTHHHHSAYVLPSEHCLYYALLRSTLIGRGRQASRL